MSGTGRHIQAPDGFQIDSVIQTDAPINPGNSGGPLLDAAGRVIGVNSQIATGGTSQGSVGIGFAVPANTVADVIPRLERGETIQRAYLGLSTPRPAAARWCARPPRAARRRAPACARATSIVAVDGKRIPTPDDVAAAIQDKAPGDSVEVELRRDGDARTRHGRARRPRPAHAEQAP